LPSSEDLFHLGIKAIIRNPEDKILLLKVNPAQLKNDRAAYWDIPGGRIERGETVEATLRREVKEETGLDHITAIRPFAMTLSNIRIPVEPADVGLILSAYICDVDDTTAIKLSPEHTDYAWYEPSDAAAMLQIKYAVEFTDKIRELQNKSGQRTANIGCEAYLVRDGRLLLGLRKNVFGAGTWALPGGHLEFMSRADATVARELKEELGLNVQPNQARLLALTDDLTPDRQTHYIHLTFGFDIGSQEPQLLEPECCAEWRWFPLDALPDNVFPPHQKILDTIAGDQVYASAPPA
jgi:8-oxo-dGTP diphosphatase